MTNNFLSIGRILNFRGLKGEAKVGFTKGKEAQILALKEVYIDAQKFDVEKVFFHKQFAIMKFKQINSIDEIINFKGKNIYITKDDAKKELQEDEFLIEDLIGLNVFDDKDDLIGTIKSVGSNKANDILCVVNEKMGREILIPFVKEIVPIIDVKGQKIVVKLIEGLIDEV